MTVLTLGLCTFVPAIQELCIFAVVGLISDFFLQMMFFAPVLALAVRSAAESDDSYLYDPSRCFIIDILYLHIYICNYLVFTRTRD